MSLFTKKRTRQHIKTQNKWTSRTNDWVEIWHQTVSSSQEARDLVKKIKGRGAARFLTDIGESLPTMK